MFGGKAVKSQAIGPMALAAMLLLGTAAFAQQAPGGNESARIEKFKASGTQDSTLPPC